jgi:hypothetical protein
MHRLIPWLSDYWVVFDSSSWHPRGDIGCICNRWRYPYVLVSSIRGYIRFVELESSISFETTITTPGAATHISPGALPLLSLIYCDINLSRGLVCGVLSVNLSASTAANDLVRGVSSSLPWQVWWDGWLWARAWPLLYLALLLGCLVRL